MLSLQLDGALYKQQTLFGNAHCIQNEPRYEKPVFCICENKAADQLCGISAFVFATQIVQSLFFLNPKFQASSQLLWLHSLVCFGPGRKPRRPVFSQRGSNNVCFHARAYHKVSCATSLGNMGEFPIGRDFVTPNCKTVPTIMSCKLSFASYCVILETKIRR